MAEAASAAVPVPLLPGLPDEISIWEILVRLPPKDLLRCRAVCPAWRRATSIHDFLLAHHDCQPNLPLIRSFSNHGESLDIIPFDHRHRAGITAADQLHPVAQIDSRDAYTLLEASCDGLLVISFNGKRFWICNLATRECAPLPLRHGFRVAGMYLHPPTDEYRLLLYNNLDLVGGEHAFHVSTLGSGQPPRHVGYFQDFTPESFFFHGSLHCCIGQMIIVFDTIAELFRQMRSPIVYDVFKDANPLFEMDGMLSVYKVNAAATSIDIWALEDYESEVWAFKCRVELPVDELRVQFGVPYSCTNVMARSLDGDLLVLARFGDWLLQIDSDGKLVASFHRRDIFSSPLMLKQTLVRHTFFPAMEGYVVNVLPFI